MNKKERLAEITEILRPLYFGARTELVYKTPFQLLGAVILSAQCTDSRVNAVTPELFGRYPGPRELAAAPLGEIERLVHSAGFYHSKALSLKQSAAAIMEKFGGRVPDTMDGLLSLRGVARKTANVVLGEAFGKTEGFVVDTHVKRLAWRMGFTGSADPVKIERDFMRQLDRADWRWFSMALVLHGRRVCQARAPRCAQCPVIDFCLRRDVNK
ncbi:MAG: endonuclease III [Elusimicrobiaceae bacterium]|nr:endonuclease III [Elusimicrobiaceae bacterium]